ncbi:MAG: hypothetical protein Q4D76_00595 [Oscillospiraceae bacterium]|nr:hypothetical protein [Oscillospiraceae bacterium]
MLRKYKISNITQDKLFFLPKEKVSLIVVYDMTGKWMLGERASFTVINNGLDVNKHLFSPHLVKEIREELGIDYD